MDKKILYQLSYGLYLIGSDNGDVTNGFICNTVFQVSSSPINICISVRKTNYTREIIEKSNLFTISTLTEDIDINIIKTFGFSSGRETQKFKNIRYAITENNQPYLLENACNYIECKVISSIDVSTHVLYIGEVLGGNLLSDKKSLTYEYYSNVLKGKLSINSPLYVKDAKSSDKYVCSVCGYVHDGNLSKYNGEFKCPVCGCDKSVFRPL